MPHHFSARKVSGAPRLSRNMATLVNNPENSDVQFKVGGRTTPSFGETICDESATRIIYAHSVILRCRSKYFAALFDRDKNCRNFDKTYISYNTFLDVLKYVYTGNIHASENIIELISIANEMGLMELSMECQAELIGTVKSCFPDGIDDENESNYNPDIGNEDYFSDFGDGDDEKESDYDPDLSSEDSFSDYSSSDDKKESWNFFQRHYPPIPLIKVISTHIVPVLNLANRDSLPNLSQKLLTIMLPRMSVIINSEDTRTAFLNGISSEALAGIIASDSLTFTEREIWDLALRWACYQADFDKSAVMTHFNSPKRSNISNAQLEHLKAILTPLLPVIRFSLLSPSDFKDIFDILNYFLLRDRFSKLTRFLFIDDGTVGTVLLDTPRVGQNALSMIVVKSKTWELLRENIFNTGGISGCLSLNDLKFELLFRASKHDFLATTFHRHCDNKGPTLVLVKSTDGQCFGAVNFTHWKSDNSWSSSRLNFLFSLPDGRYRNNWAVFRIEDRTKAQHSSYNFPIYGPVFGSGCDLYIADSANINTNSYSNLPSTYNGSGASNTALASARNFKVLNYEVFAISK